MSRVPGAMAKCAIVLHPPRAPASS